MPMFRVQLFGVGQAGREDRLAQAQLAVSGEELDGPRAPRVLARIERPERADHAAPGDGLAGKEV